MVSRACFTCPRRRGATAPIRCRSRLRSAPISIPPWSWCKTAWPWPCRSCLPGPGPGNPVRKKSPEQLMIISFYSSDERYIDRDLSNFALINLKDELLRVDGVSDVSIMGERDYAIRIWLDPRKLASRGMTAMDVAGAVRNQRIQAAPGQTGQPPASVRQTSQLPIDILGRLSTPEQFGDIVVKVGAPDAGTAGASADSAAGGSGTALPSSTSAAPIKGFTPASNADSSSTSSAAASRAAEERTAAAAAPAAAAPTPAAGRPGFASPVRRRVARPTAFRQTA